MMIINAFLEEKSPESLIPGDIVDIQGNVLGRHGGLPLYTVGQRKGLGLAAGMPLYVVALDAANNKLIVGNNDAVFAAQLIAEDLNYIAMDELTQPLVAAAKIRYSAKEAAGPDYTNV